MNSETANAARKDLFTIKAKSLCNLPPTSDALAMHELRAAYQGGNIWCVKKKSHHRLVGDGRKKTEFGLSVGLVNQQFGKSVENFLSVNASKALRKDAGVPCPLHMEVVNFNANIQTECHYHLKKLAEHLTCAISKETTSWALGIRDQLKGSWYADEEKVTVSVEPGDTFRSEGTAAPNRMQDMNLDELKTAMSQLTLDSKRATRVLSTMIYSIALHPSETKLLVAAGGRAGEIGRANQPLYCLDRSTVHVVEAVCDECTSIHSAKENSASIGSRDGHYPFNLHAPMGSPCFSHWSRPGSSGGYLTQ
uniref:Uncharacterized protein n=1 Tax=Timema tahoe TaxID=61484 RepID=A0A7R9FMD4_9NEOP|nr:unnamed protein product [Timema tahoe]